VSFIHLKKPYKLPTVNEKQEAAKQGAELKRLQAERQKMKAKKQAKRSIPGSDEEDEEDMNERPNNTVCVNLFFSKLRFADKT
jgi:hypothetical protein